MEKIPTAEEFVKTITNSGGGRNIYSKEEIAHVAREFAKLHVEAALKAASEKAQIAGRWGSDKEWKSDEINTTDADGDWILLKPDKNSILSAYPLENIK